MSMQKGSNELPKWTLDPALKNISFETPLDHFKSEWQKKIDVEN